MEADDDKAATSCGIEEAAEGGEVVIITKKGRPVSRLVPYRAETKKLFGRGQDKIRILGDVAALTDAEWEAETNSHPYCGEVVNSDVIATALPGPDATRDARTGWGTLDPASVLGNEKSVQAHCPIAAA